MGKWSHLVQSDRVVLGVEVEEGHVLEPHKHRVVLHDPLLHQGARGVQPSGDNHINSRFSQAIGPAASREREGVAVSLSQADPRGGHKQSLV